MSNSCSTHEEYIQCVAEIAIARLNAEDRAKAREIKLVYGAGPNGVRGVTYFKKWSKGEEEIPFVEISAFNQSSAVQLAGTTIHELGHVLAGWEAAHGKLWKASCEALGLRRILAAGTDYKWSMFAPDIRAAIALLPQPKDGKPKNLLSLAGAPVGAHKAFKGCQAGWGTKGGKSRGTGSGSRLHLFECECVPVVKVRKAGTEFDATCNCCQGLFHFVK